MRPSPTLCLTSLLALLGLVGHAVAQTPTIGLVVDADCAEIVTASTGGELYGIKSDGGPSNDWQFHLYSKGAGGLGMSSRDFSAGTYQFLSGNFTRPEAPSDAVAAYVTFGDGSIHVNSGDLSIGFNFMGGALVQSVGDGAEFLPQSADVVLPGDEAEYFSDLGDGPERFPRVHGGGIEFAFGPVLDLALVDQGLGDCRYGGASLGQSGSGRWIAGYNVYRILDTGVVPATWEVAAPENLQDSFEFTPSGDLSHTLARWQDPDGQPFSGDEVLLYHDSETLADGTPRTMGTAPDLSGDRAYWYVIQPFAPGNVRDWESISVAKGPVGDSRLDFDGDGLFDAVDADRDGSPEFISPQAELGRPGLGLTHDGSPLVSKAVLATPPAPDVGDSLRLGPGGRLSWAARNAALRYRVRRGTDPNFLAENPRLLARDLLSETEDPTFVDAALPLPGGVLYYHVSSLDRFGRESFEGSLASRVR